MLTTKQHILLTRVMNDSTKTWERYSKWYDLIVKHSDRLELKPNELRVLNSPTHPIHFSNADGIDWVGLFDSQEINQVFGIEVLYNPNDNQVYTFLDEVCINVSSQSELDFDLPQILYEFYKYDNDDVFEDNFNELYAHSLKHLTINYEMDESLGVWL